MTKRYSKAFPKLDCAGCVELLRETGGFTIHPTRGDVPEKGYAVALEGMEVKVSERGLCETDEQCAQMIGLYADLFESDLRSCRGYHVGGWVHEGELYLDISEVVESREAADVLARVRNQLAYYDIEGEEEIAVSDGPEPWVQLECLEGRR